ncbi:MAG: ISKra4 family transposase [Acidobacteriota bacterium]
MRGLASLGQLLAQIRVAPDPPPAPATRPPPAAPPPRPTLALAAPSLMQIEQRILDQGWPQMRAALQADLDARADAEACGPPPHCCGTAMAAHDRRPVTCQSWLGTIRIPARRWRCRICHRDCRPLVDQLELEPGRPSGLLARLLGLLGCVASYPLAADLAAQLLRVQVNPMTIWRAVQRLGEAAAAHTEALSAHHADPRTPQPVHADAPAAVLVGMDGCALGMQVRTRRRRRPTADAVLPPLPPVEDGHFREVKTGVLLVPDERVALSPTRHSVVRRVLVTCLGTADEVFARLWAQLAELGWVGEHTVVVVVGDGAAWIWNRAAHFGNVCEILDFWHALEHAWTYARLQFGEGSRQADRWASRLAHELKAGGVADVIARLKTLQPRSDASREALEALIQYYTDHAARMRYHEYLRLGYGIGSGAVESAHKQVVHARFRQAGMRWSVQGARRLLALRLLLLNGQWATTAQLRMPTALAA